MNNISLSVLDPPPIIERVVSVTKSIRVGSATLLSHYSALSIAEQFEVLASYFPDRMDLGLRRAPGTDRNTASVLNRQTANFPPEFMFCILLQRTAISLIIIKILINKNILLEQE